LGIVLTSLGEKLSENECDELMKYVEVHKDGLIAYEGNEFDNSYSNAQFH
jgi:Ca2+-binding EF-hand superfamily protein